MTTGEKIKRERLKQGLTQSQLAEKMGIKGATLGQWETGRREPRGYTLKRLASALGVSVESLTSGDDSARPLEVEKTTALDDAIDGIKRLILLREWVEKNDEYVKERARLLEEVNQHMKKINNDGIAELLEIAKKLSNDEKYRDELQEWANPPRSE